MEVDHDGERDGALVAMASGGAWKHGGPSRSNLDRKEFAARGKVM